MPHQFLNLPHAAAVLTVLLLVCVGCKARELGSNFADTQSATVDNTWVTAADTCWPALAHQDYSIEVVKHYLADPVHFRAAFAVYAQLSDGTLRSIVAAPVANAPPPDVSVLANSQSPVITRTQALMGVTSAPNHIPGADSLCSIQPGLPVGFR